MKQQIHTFELWDAFEAKTDCPICDIQSNVETQRTAFQTWIEKFITPAAPKNYKKDQNRRSCHLCSHVEERIKDYIATLIELWKNNLNFRALYYVGNGFCHQHFHQIINYAKKELKDEDLDNFLYTTFRIQKESMKRLNEELQWFIKKFNYHYKDTAWGSSKDSLARCISKMR